MKTNLGFYLWYETQWMTITVGSLNVTDRKNVHYRCDLLLTDGNPHTVTVMVHWLLPSSIAESRLYMIDVCVASCRDTLRSWYEIDLGHCSRSYILIHKHIDIRQHIFFSSSSHIEIVFQRYDGVNKLFKRKKKNNNKIQFPSEEIVISMSPSSSRIHSNHFLSFRKFIKFFSSSCSIIPTVFFLLFFFVWYFFIRLSRRTFCFFFSIQRRVIQLLIQSLKFVPFKDIWILIL